MSRKSPIPESSPAGPVCVRFAPSPTGPLHIGGVRTALYNYLLAKKHQGRFILRIEDTDQVRQVPGAEAYIQEVLQWLGIVPDEGPHTAGPNAPYRQSDRKHIYPKYVDQLLAAGHAYYAFDTAEELEAMRAKLQAARVAAPKYNAVIRESMRNALTLPQEEVEALLQAGAPHVVRLKVPHQGVIRFYDHVRGWIQVQAATLDDKVLVKSDGIPTYHLAHVIDDHVMGISHVIRGEEWLPSTPIHILLYQYLGIAQALPQFVHLPLLLNPQGQGKLSKREVETLGLPIFPLDWKDPITGAYMPGFREAGYLPEALLNFLALLGWSPSGGQQEIFSREELISHFSVAHIHKAGVRLDIHKARWFNQQHLKRKPQQERVAYLTAALQAHQLTYTPEQVAAVCELIEDRVAFPQDFWEQGKCFFQAPESHDLAIIHARGCPPVYELLSAWIEVLRALSHFAPDAIQATLQNLLANGGMRSSDVMPIVRVALTGTRSGPDLMQSMALLGQAEVIQRLSEGLAAFRQITQPAT